MKRFLFLMFAGLLVGNAAHSQSDEPKKKLNSPQEKVTVNKKFDENGNMTSFDSTYVYSWSSDSTLNGFPGDIDFSDFFNWKGSFFDNDSDSINDPFHGFNFNDGDIENLSKRFSGMIPDSLDQNLYSFRNDSVLRFFGDSVNAFQFRGDTVPDFHWQLNDSTIMRFFSKPEISTPNDSIRQKNQKLLEKYMKEIEEFEKKFFQF